MFSAATKIAAVAGGEAPALQGRRLRRQVPSSSAELNRATMISPQGNRRLTRREAARYNSVVSWLPLGAVVVVGVLHHRPRCASGSASLAAGHRTRTSQLDSRPGGQTLPAHCERPDREGIGVRLRPPECRRLPGGAGSTFCDKGRVCPGSGSCHGCHAPKEVHDNEKPLPEFWPVCLRLSSSSWRRSPARSPSRGGGTPPLTSNGAVVPFRLDIAGAGPTLKATLYNGDVPSTTTARVVRRTAS